MSEAEPPALAPGSRSSLLVPQHFTRLIIMSNDAPAPDVIPSQYRGEQTISSLAVDLKVDASTLPNGHLDSLMLNWRASCYIATAQVSADCFDVLMTRAELARILPDLPRSQRSSELEIVCR